MNQNHKVIFSIELTKTSIKSISGCNVFEDKFSKFVAFDGNTLIEINTHRTAERNEMY